MSKIAIILDTFDVKIIKFLLDKSVEGMKKELKKELEELEEKSAIPFEVKILEEALNAVVSIANKVEAAQLADQMKGEKKS